MDGSALKALPSKIFRHRQGGNIMSGISEKDAQMLQNLKQKDTVCTPIHTEFGPYWDKLTVKRTTKNQIITEDNQHFRKRDGYAVGETDWLKRIYPMTKERERIIRRTKNRYEEIKQKRRLIFRIKRCNYNQMSLSQLRQIDAIMGDVE